jgi:hypothetical protein
LIFVTETEQVGPPKYRQRAEISASKEPAIPCFQCLAAGPVCAAPLGMNDTTLTVRCPFCLAGAEFLVMVAYKDGRFVCRDCAHTVRPGVPEYRCICRLCLGMARNDDF